MRHVYRLILVCVGPSLLLLTGCATGGHVSAGGPYHVTAYKPNDPSKVRVLVSISKENIYVMEGDRCLMAVACSIGTPAKPTPKGNFTIYSKQEHKRSGSYGFSVQGNRVVPSTGGGPGRYVGYPMGYWCEFAPAYGFHQGFVHPTPRTHGCIRLKGEAAPKFFALVRIGTPVNIAN
jgi:lipoprotein-anchoring transpeptidase ErfK/SrfK